MDTTSKIIIMVLVIVGVFLATYQVTVSTQTGYFIKEMNKQCGFIADFYNQNTDELSAYSECYCYYSNSAPPEGYEGITSPMCACNCRKHDGTVHKIQVLAAGNILANT
ncbi:MAG TPA: hypothetical protein ENN30_00765 [Candidatus Woesearchaeota archaeon]|nr:hypothetical protein [Candidatus Woesearchaeota archaeon]